MENKGFFITAWLCFYNLVIKNSVTYRCLLGLYNGISRSWQNSCITNLFRKQFLTEETAADSLWGKICFSPFLLLEKIGTAFGEKLISQKEKSLVVRFFKFFLHNSLALNLRFLGVFIFCGALSDLIVSLVLGQGLLLSVLAIILGLFLYLFDFNLTTAFKGSRVVKLLENCLDAKFNFDFFYITKCEGKSRLTSAVVLGVITGLICGAVSPVLALLFVLGLLFFCLVLYKVEFGVFVTVFLAPLVPTMVLVGLSLFCLFSLIVKYLTTKKFAWRLEGCGLMIITMLLIYLVAALTSFAPFKSVQIWLVYFAFMIFYFVLINTIKTKNQLFNILKVFVLSGGIVCLYGLLQYIFGWNVNQAWMDEEMFEDIKMRIYSTLENPNVLGEYILLVLPVCISLMWTSKKVLSKIVYAGLSGLLGIALILTFSRGCWLGIMASASVFVTFVCGKLWGLALIAIPILPMVLPQSIINRFSSIGDMKDSSTSYRVYIWMGTLLMLKDFWLSGIGPGTEAFTQVYPFYSYSAIVAPHSHNLFLQVLVESGILGIFAFVLLIILFMKNSISGYLAFGKGNPLSVVIVGIASGIIGFLVQGLFDNCFYNYRVFMIFFSVIALGIAASKIAKTESQKTEVSQNA
ncbi:MAG: O-antigen ligase family protein [Clostridia bacterium]|nr:O-antigen ligase family protein [Clostridia bacterium]